jgi:tRNA pseudouridine38-40 synthase
MTNIILTIAYDGTRFVGWQKTNLDPIKWPSIEYELEHALEPLLGHVPNLQAASRTDRGVHADAQVVNFVTTKDLVDLQRFHYSLNCLLPAEIRVLTVNFAAHPEFHATVDAKAKEYHYNICFAKTLHPLLRINHWHFPHSLHLEKMAMASDILLGEHDFKAFRNMRKGIDYNDTVRTIYGIDIIKNDRDTLTIKITGTNFLYKMARNIAGTLAYVGCDKLTAGQVSSLLTSGDRTAAGMTAPAWGLTLHKVFYSYPQDASIPLPHRM